MNHTSQKIDSRLIIYRSARHFRACQNNIKYGFAPSRFNPSADKLKKPLEKRLLALPMKRYVQSIFARFTLKVPENNLTLKFLKRIRNFKNIFIYFFPLNLIDRQGWDVQCQAKKALKKAFMLSPKVTKMRLFFMSGGLEERFVLPFKDLCYMNSLKEIECIINSTLNQQFQSLANFLIKTKRRRQREIKPILHASPGLLLDQTFDCHSLANILEKINLIQQDSRLNLDLNLRPNITLLDILTFSQSFKKFPNLERFSLNFPANVQLSNFLEALKDNRRLKEMSLKFTPSESSIPVDILSHFILSTPSLTELELVFIGPPDNQSLKEFFYGLPTNTFLSTLVIRFSKYENLDDSALISFAQSLKKFKTLKRLNFWTNNKSPDLTQAGIRIFFNEISELKDLQKLELNLCEQKEKVSDDVFAVLCNSLGNLKDLQSMRIYLSGNNITDVGIARLSKIIPALKRLDTIWLDFDKAVNEGLTGKSLHRLLNNFVCLPSLVHLDFTIKGVDIDDFCSKMLIYSLRNLKALNHLSFHLRSNNLDICITDYLQQAFQQFGKKFEAAFYLTHAETSLNEIIV